MEEDLLHNAIDRGSQREQRRQGQSLLHRDLGGQGQHSWYRQPKTSDGGKTEEKEDEDEDEEDDKHDAAAPAPADDDDDDDDDEVRSSWCGRSKSCPSRFWYCGGTSRKMWIT